MFGPDHAVEFVACIHYKNRFEWTFQSGFKADARKEAENNLALHVM